MTMTAGAHTAIAIISGLEAAVVAALAEGAGANPTKGAAVAAAGSSTPASFASFCSS
jgi:hypothetical protein